MVLEGSDKLLEARWEAVQSLLYNLLFVVPNKCTYESEITWCTVLQPGTVKAAEAGLEAG